MRLPTCNCPILGAGAIGAVVLSAVVLMAAGCQESEEAPPIPQSEVARQALVRALEGWQQGLPAGETLAGAPEVQAFDFQWQGGQQLLAFEIRNELPADGPKQFAVLLTLGGAAPGANKKPGAGLPGQQSASYFVLGSDPVFVYRDRDFEQVSGK